MGGRERRIEVERERRKSGVGRRESVLHLLHLSQVYSCHDIKIMTAAVCNMQS